MPLTGLHWLGRLAKGVQALGARVAEPAHMQPKPTEVGVGARLPVSELIYTERVELLQPEVGRFVSKFQECLKATRRAVETDTAWERYWIL